MFTIRQNAAGQWEVVDAAGAVLSTHANYSLGLEFVGAQLAGMAAFGPPSTALAAPPGALPERWTSGPNGVAIVGDTGQGDPRNFSECVYTFRDGPLPLMFHNVSSWEHQGAVLAGWADENTVVDGTPFSSGWFHDSEAGRALRDVMLAQGRFGVSVDPGGAEWEERCEEADEDGWCLSSSTWFTRYQIAGMTAEPFPAFEEAWLELAAGAAESAAGSTEGADAEQPAAVAASAATVVRPPRLDYFTMLEPDDDDPRYVTQLSTGGLAIPLTIEDPDADGWRHAYGHVYPEGACHIGYRDQCVTAPASPTGYANFNLYECPAPGGPAVGTLVYGLDHAPLAGVSLQQVRDTYAHTGLGWASVRASNGRHGGWFTGVVRRDVSDEAVAVLRASGVSGDWREWGDYDLDMFGLQSVNMGGFPITRERLVAAGGIELGSPLPFARIRNGRVVELRGVGIVRRSEAELRGLVASGVVRCSACGEQQGARLGRSRGGRDDDRLDRALALLGVLDRRTRHLIPAERDALAARLGVARIDGTQVNRAPGADEAYDDSLIRRTP